MILDQTTGSAIDSSAPPSTVSDELARRAAIMCLGLKARRLIHEVFQISLLSIVRHQRDEVSNCEQQFGGSSQPLEDSSTTTQ
jgi:hypothetical protein